MKVVGGMRVREEGVDAWEWQGSEHSLPREDMVLSETARVQQGSEDSQP